MRRIGGLSDNVASLLVAEIGMNIDKEKSNVCEKRFSAV